MKTLKLNTWVVHCCSTGMDVLRVNTFVLHMALLNIKTWTAWRFSHLVWSVSDQTNLSKTSNVSAPHLNPHHHHRCLHPSPPHRRGRGPAALFTQGERDRAALAVAASAQHFQPPHFVKQSLAFVGLPPHPHTHTLKSLLSKHTPGTFQIGTCSLSFFILQKLHCKWLWCKALHCLFEELLELKSPDQINGPLLDSILQQPWPNDSFIPA